MTDARERLRLVSMWACVALFWMRVVAQLEVKFLEPAWLPPMDAWYSGLVPYAWLVPAQIVLLMLMSVVAFAHSAGIKALMPTRRTTRAILRWIAMLYAVAMAVRLGLALSKPPHELLASGAIPVLFHWILATFIWLVSAAPQHEERSRSAADLVSAQDLFGYPHAGDAAAELRASAEKLIRARRLLDV